jgi:hypothetical protein
MHRGVRPFPSFSRIYSAPSSSNADCMQSIRLYLTDEANQTFTHLLKAEISSYTSSSNAYHPSPPSSPNLSFLQSSIANVSSAGPSTPGRSRNPTSSSSGVHPSSPSTSTGSPFPTPTTPTRKRLFNYTSPAYTSPQRSPQRYAAGLDDPTHDAYSVSPVTYESQRLLLSPRKATRRLELDERPWRRTRELRLLVEREYEPGDEALRSDGRGDDAGGSWKFGPARCCYELELDWEGELDSFPFAVSNACSPSSPPSRLAIS